MAPTGCVAFFLGVFKLEKHRHCSDCKAQAGSSGSSAIGRGLATRKRKTTSVEWSKQFEGLPAHEFAPAADSEGGGFLRGHDVVVVHAH